MGAKETHEAKLCSFQNEQQNKKRVKKIKMLEIYLICISIERESIDILIIIPVHQKMCAEGKPKTIKYQNSIQKNVYSPLSNGVPNELERPPFQHHWNCSEVSSTYNANR